MINADSAAGGLAVGLICVLLLAGTLHVIWPRPAPPPPVRPGRRGRARPPRPPRA